MPLSSSDRTKVRGEHLNDQELQAWYAIGGNKELAPGYYSGQIAENVRDSIYGQSDAGGSPPPAPAAPAPTAAPPPSGGAPPGGGSIGALSTAGGGGSLGSGGDSLTSLQTMAGSGGEAAAPVSGTGALRSGIGVGAPPQYSNSLAALLRQAGY